MTQNIETLGILEQNLSSLVVQRQTLQKQILEAEHALKELDAATDAYQIVGTVMIKKSAATLIEELTHKKETLSIKVTSVRNQEESLRKQVEEVQASIMATMDKGE